ncbi:MAG: dienelactone hydrolase family protein [Alphaproteobacteria bacterium]
MEKGLSRRAVLALTLAGLAGAGMTAPPPVAAHFPGKRTRRVSTTTDKGRRVTAQVFMPDDAAGPAPSVMVLHDGAGLAANIRWVNAEIGRRGYLAVAPDLYEGLPDPPRTPAEQVERMAALDPESTLDSLRSWLRWQKAHFRSSGRVGVVAFGDGAPWAARAIAAETSSALVCVHPPLADTAFELAARRGVLMLHLSARDQPAETERVATLERIAATSGQRVAAFWYDAHVGFANFLGNTYDKEADTLALARTTDFLAQTLRLLWGHDREGYCRCRNWELLPWPLRPCGPRPPSPRKASRRATRTPGSRASRPIPPTIGRSPLAGGCIPSGR